MTRRYIKTGLTQKSKMKNHKSLHINMDKELYENVKIIARKSGKTASHIIHELLRNFVVTQKTTLDKKTVAHISETQAKWLSACKIDEKLHLALKKKVKKNNTSIAKVLENAAKAYLAKRLSFELKSGLVFPSKTEKGKGKSVVYNLDENVSYSFREKLQANNVTARSFAIQAIKHYLSTS